MISFFLSAKINLSDRTMLDVMFTNAKQNVLPILEPETDLGRFELWKQSKPFVQRLVSIAETALEGFCFLISAKIKLKINLKPQKYARCDVY